MNTSDSQADMVFMQAVQAIDEGNLIALQRLVSANPVLAGRRCNAPAEGYFRHPYLLWFIAGNPVRQDSMPPNIEAITLLLIHFVQQQAPATFKEQINYTLELVATSRTAYASGCQPALMDILLDAGAAPLNVHPVLAAGNTAAVQQLINKGSVLTLAAAACLDLKADTIRLAHQAGAADRVTALVAAAFYGNARMVSFLISEGADVNAWPDSNSGFHAHATALHQAVSAASPDTVKTLVEAGANTAARDHIYHGTPLDWAQYLEPEEKDPGKKQRYAAIQHYLSSQSGNVLNA